MNSVIIDQCCLPWAQNRIPKGSRAMLLISLDSVLIFQLLRKTKNNEQILLNVEARRGGLRTDTAQ